MANVVNFRIPIGDVANQRVFINGAAVSHRGYNKGDTVLVRWKQGGTDVHSAEVVDIRRAGRDDYAWEIVG